jgi:hypothetical protein
MTLDEMLKYLEMEEEYTMPSFVQIIERKRKMLTLFSKIDRPRSEHRQTSLDKYSHIYSIIQKEYPEYLV